MNSDTPHYSSENGLRSDPSAPEVSENIAVHNAAETTCPVCGSSLQQEKCKVVCRSAACVYRIIFNCSEF